MSNWYYLTGKLDKEYLRICACYRLLKRGVITANRAKELIRERKPGGADATVDIWVRHLNH